MATIEKYQTVSGTMRYMVRYRKPDRGTKMKRGFKTKRQAEQWANNVEVEKMTGSYVAPALGRIMVGEVAGDWLAHKKLAAAPSHYRMLDSAWRVYVKPHWGTVSSADIDVCGVEAWIASMGTKGAGPPR